MVNKEVVQFLQEGMKRGFSVQMLKQRLVQTGFKDKEVDKAIKVLNKGKKLPRTPAQPGTVNPGAVETRKVPKNRKLMKWAGWLGIVLLSLFVILFGLSFIPGVNDDINFFFKDTIISVITFLIIIAYSVFYYLALLKLGKFTGSKLLKVSSWIMLIYGILVPILLIIGTLIWWDSLVGLIASLGLTIFFGGGTFLIYFVVAILVIYFAVKISISIGLIKIGRRVKQTKIAGLFSISFVSLVLINAVISSFIPQLINLIISILILLSGILSSLFTSLALLNGSKQFER